MNNESGRADGPADHDALDFRPYVDAVAEHLTIEAKPLTISVEGEWGAGKTSFMRQLQARLKDPERQAKKGFRAWISGKWRARRDKPFTVWFNAWRHDKEDALWASFAVHFVDELRAQITLVQPLALAAPSVVAI